MKSWRWFKGQVRHLLAHDTPIGRFFAPEPEPEPEAVTDE